jgi:hypothetical protein
MPDETFSLDLGEVVVVVSFQKSLEKGKLGESLVAGWLASRGWYILPVYELELNQGKGPRVFGPGKEQIIAPDALLLHPRKRKVCFAECKHKTHFSYHRISQSWQTGIDFRHWQEYLKLRDILGREVWLLFLHQSEIPWENDRRHGCPDRCPTGLFAEEIGKLRLIGRVDHRHANGMIYWNHQDLIKLADLDEVIRVDDRTSFSTGMADAVLFENRFRAQPKGKKSAEGQLLLFDHKPVLLGTIAKSVIEAFPCHLWDEVREAVETNHAGLAGDFQELQRQFDMCRPSYKEHEIVLGEFIDKGVQLIASKTDILKPYGGSMERAEKFGYDSDLENMDDEFMAS